MSSLTIDEVRPTFTRAGELGAARPGRGRIWTGRVLSGLAAAFLLFDAAMKLILLPVVVKATHEIGFPEGSVFGIGLTLFLAVTVYLVPRTALIGAVLLTGYLGGAIATNVRIGAPLFTHVLAPIYVAVFIWGGLYLRDARVRALVGPRS
ncbi:MAG TPA: DoxX family protein [Polyangia bacterium]|nr:DoxX family protein [Polyangia bacterium]